MDRAGLRKYLAKSDKVLAGLYGSAEEEVRWGGVGYLVAFREQKISEDFAIGGREVTERMSFRLPREVETVENGRVQVQAPPADGQVVTHGGRSYEVDGLTPDAGGWLVYCMGKAK